MDNKLVSLIIKVGMGILLLVGIILIWSNLSYDSTGDEPTANQEFFVETYEIPAKEEGGKPTEESITRYNFVLDNDNNVVYDLSNHSTYELEPFVMSKGKTKTKKDSFKDEVVDPVLLNEYELLGATESSVTYTWWLMWGGLALIGIFTIINIVQNPKRFIPSAIGTAVLAIIAFICYSSVVTKAPAGSKVLELKAYSDASYQMTGMGIVLFITLAVIAGALILVGTIAGMLRYFSK